MIGAVVGWSVCQACGRGIATADEPGVWFDPVAQGDDVIWRDTCDESILFTAEHLPAPRNEVSVARIRVAAALEAHREESARLWAAWLALPDGESAYELEDEELEVRRIALDRLTVRTSSLLAALDAADKAVAE